MKTHVSYSNPIEEKTSPVSRFTAAVYQVKGDHIIQGSQGDRRLGVTSQVKNNQRTDRVYSALESLQYSTLSLINDIDMFDSRTP